MWLRGETSDCCVHRGHVFSDLRHCLHGDLVLRILVKQKETGAAPEPLSENVVVEPFTDHAVQTSEEHHRCLETQYLRSGASTLPVPSSTELLDTCVIERSDPFLCPFARQLCCWLTPNNMRNEETSVMQDDDGMDEGRQALLVVLAILAAVQGREGVLDKRVRLQEE